MQTRVPISTYRIQFNPKFRFSDGKNLVSYLRELGISDCYTSPLMQATPGSMHGYDVTNPTRFNPDIGTEEEFGHFAEELLEHKMSILVDIIPNHMCISVPYNDWWNNVLENGPSSPYANYFNIEWNPLRQELEDKVLLPFLDDQFGKVIENKELQVTYSEGSFYIQYFESIYPTNPSTWIQLLEPVVNESRDRETEGLVELESIVTSIRYLPNYASTQERDMGERQREKEIIKRRLKRLTQKCKKILSGIKNSLIRINGTKEAPHTFDHLEEFLKSQPYRLCHWRVASDEINYRRFFDINELAGIQAENAHLFKNFHSVFLKLVNRGWVKGLRIDHVDGLYNPHKYLMHLQNECKKITDQPLYIVIEKILSKHESIRKHWPVHGTTGYDFLNQVNSLYIKREHSEDFHRNYSKFCHLDHQPEDLLYSCKSFILNVSMSSELHVLARQLDRISEQHRWYQDFSYQSLIASLRSVMASFTSYRSYICAEERRIDKEDREVILKAVEKAKERNPAMNVTIFDFIKDVLMLNEPPGVTEKQREIRDQFAMRFQQLTGPVMAKGLEDTAFYRYYPLSSLNEVGAELGDFGLQLHEFHKFNQKRLQHSPHSLLTTSTHDTKRSEDVRARLNVLSEIPKEWFEAVSRWEKLNRKLKTGGPDKNEEYLLYQTIIGAWPLEEMDDIEHRSFVERIITYMNKALKEAKIHTSWMNPNDEYDQKVQNFIRTILKKTTENRFLDDLKSFVKRIATPGMYNSLSQLVIKLTSPGIPDIYQGCELWDFSLVDPDNRRAVNYDKRKEILKELQTGSLPLEKMIQSAESGHIKMYTLMKGLQLRRDYQTLFETGDYIPLYAEGDKWDKVIAYSRALNGETAITIAGRFFTELEQYPWGDAKIDGLHPGTYRDILTGKIIESDGSIEVSTLLNPLPIALLVLR